MSNLTIKRDISALPGLVDLQVNGFHGVDFNEESLHVENVERVCKFLLEEGVCGFLPTLITNAPEVIESLAETILSANDSGGAKILGLHLEGPFISPKDGHRGAHPKNHVAPPDFDWICKLNDSCEGRIRIITFSPEWPGAGKFTEQICGLGIKAAIGHTDANQEQISEAVAAGASLSTHIGNGIAAMLPRHPNPIWSQLAEKKLWCSLIGDGFHLPREVFETILELKYPKAFLVSDCTKFTGMPPGRYESPIGGEVVLEPNGRLHLANDENLLAGSAISLRNMIEKLTDSGYMSFEKAWELGSIRPMEFLC